ncbi:MAG: hypothetical protein D6796_01860 [Caldilineae bacterium]|nr:MAG: hypothetical protein D6796_01860 [Caldilineae bacterium]
MANPTRLDELKAFLRTQGWRWSPGKPIPHGEQIVVTDGAHQATVNFYPKHGKLVIGGPASPLKAALTAWHNREPLPATSPPTSPPELASPPPAGSRLDALKQFIREQGWNWGSGADIPYGEQIVVSDAGLTALVNFWPKRGKMQVQGPDSPLKAALQAWVTGDADPASDVITGPHIGMDEAGKGDWFGPLVVAAVYADEQTAALLRQIGVQDSKTLLPDTIQYLVGQIEHIVPADRRHVWAIEPETYNRLYEEQGNVNLLLADAYAQVAEKVWSAIQTQTIVCDQFSQRTDRLENAFAARGLPCPVQQPRAESASIAVAAASILASAAFGEVLSRLGQEAGLDGPLPKGASDVETLEAAARHILDTQGPEALGRYAKLHFKPIRALLGADAAPVAAPLSGNQPRPGPPVTVRCEAWRVQYHPNGFWRYTFQDGGYLDWWEGSAKGTIYVHGKPDAESVRVLKPKTEGKSWHGEREVMDKAVANYIPRYCDIDVPSVLGVGWRRSDTVLGARFDFSDGGVLNYYRGKDTLTIQGTPSPLTRAALETLSSPFWAGPDELTDTLKRLFPDWQLGREERPDEEGEMQGETWSPLEGALNWQALWPGDKVMRRAANGAAPCQRAMVEDWASVLTHHQGKRHLLVHAPTGLGKTLAALAPALAWVAQAPDQRRVYYLVNRVTQHENPLRELRDGLAMRFEAQTDQPLRVVDIVGRDLLCNYPQARALPDSCRDARDTADWSLLPAGVASWREVQEHLADRACTYHTLQGLMAQAHVVICDYWWLFSQRARESGLVEQAGFSPTDSILIVDEAHNLPARVRAWLDVNEPLERIADTVRRAPLAVQRCLSPVLDTLREAESDEGVPPSALLPQAGGAGGVRAALADLEADELAEASTSIPERILRLLLQPDEAVVIYPALDFENGARRLVFRLVDPTPVLGAGYGRVYASLSMSGTLSAPADGEAELRYQVPLFGLSPREALSRRYASPFPLRNQRWIYCPDTLGTYRERANYLGRYADYIVKVGQATPGVTAVFFSSYVFLEQVRAEIADGVEQALIVAERRADAEQPGRPGAPEGYEQRLRALVREYGRAYLFAVYQGKLAEGADFRGNLIKTVVCVSIPMEYPALFHQRLGALYAERFAEIAEALGDDPQTRAREYALDRLSLSWVLQACGRGIRSETDRCAFVLLDKRYHDYGWRRFLEPRPYNVRQPETNVQGFHQEQRAAPERTWDAALLRFAGER